MGVALVILILWLVDCLRRLIGAVIRGRAPRSGPGREFVNAGYAKLEAARIDEEYRKLLTG